MSEQQTPVQETPNATAEGTAPEAPAAVATAATATGAAEPQQTPAAGTTPAAADEAGGEAQPATRFHVTGEDGTESDVDDPHVAFARLQRGDKVFDRKNGCDYAEFLAKRK